MALPPREVTRLLVAWQQGNHGAGEQLMSLVYGELCRLARLYLHRESSGHTLQTVDLVHEAFLRLIEQRRVGWRNREQFFRLTALLMRRLLVDHARQRRAVKRGGGQRLPLSTVRQGASAPRPWRRIALRRAMASLGRRDPRQVRIVELRFLGGLSIQETADALELSPATVKREWAVAKAWLSRELAALA